MILYFTQSFQNAEAENFFLIIVFVPNSKLEQVATWPPEEREISEDIKYHLLQKINMHLNLVWLDIAKIC